MTRLVCGNETFDVRMQVLINLSLFQACPELLRDGYRVKSTTDHRIFIEFLNAVAGDDIELSDKNIFVLADPCKEFGFQYLKLKIDEYVWTHPEKHLKFEQPAIGPSWLPTATVWEPAKLWTGVSLSRRNSSCISKADGHGYGVIKASNAGTVQTITSLSNQRHRLQRVRS